MTIQPRNGDAVGSLPVSSAPVEQIKCSATIITAYRYRIRALILRENTFVIVRKGSKMLYSGNGKIIVGAGQGVMIARDTQWDIVNDPRAEPYYEAIALSFDDRIIQLFESQYGSGKSTKVSSAKLVQVGKALLDSLQRTLPAAEPESLSASLLQHRVLEVLLLLAEQGYSFDSRHGLSWSDRIRRLVANQPGADWSVESLALAFHLSEATLRRRLKDSGIPIATLVREIRLEIALGMLQTTDLPIGEVAHRCGWESHSRFSSVFQERWGVAPTMVRIRMKDFGQESTETG